MTAISDFADVLACGTSIAILSGVRPGEGEGTADAPMEAGLTLIEVPPNSPGPLDSIARLAQRRIGPAAVGASAGAGLVSLPGNAGAFVAALADARAA